MFSNETRIDDNIKTWLSDFIAYKDKYKDKLTREHSYNNFVNNNGVTNDENPTVSINLRVVLSLIIDKCHDFIETPQFVNEIYWKYSVLFIIQVNYPTYIYYDTGIYNNVFSNLIREIVTTLQSSSNIHSFLNSIQSLYDKFENLLKLPVDDIILFSQMMNQYKIKSSICFS